LPRISTSCCCVVCGVSEPMLLALLIESRAMDRLELWQLTRHFAPDGRLTSCSFARRNSTCEDLHIQQMLTTSHNSLTWNTGCQHRPLRQNSAVSRASWSQLSSTKVDAVFSTRSLRLSYTNLLSAPFVRTSFGVRSFSVAAPKIWNSLALYLRTYTSPDIFRHHLKTHY